MATNIPTAFTDDSARTAREAEVPDASFGNGTNLSASNAHGVGINIDGGAIDGSPEQFTLLDQRGIARVSQISQSIGGYPYNPASNYPLSGGSSGTSPDAVIYVADVGVAGDGSASKLGQASLDDLATGWVTAP